MKSIESFKELAFGAKSEKETIKKYILQNGFDI
jgi:hypothetical protein